jgi:S-DNA-T family DNA segregation ATPase FtsK/SpoIIIE
MEVTVGRSRQASVVLNDRFISSLHLALRLDANGQVSVRDLGSTNGTFLQGKRLQPNRSYPLHPGERLAVGSENVVYTL